MGLIVNSREGGRDSLFRQRSSNIELLRIVSMFLVLLIHYVPSRGLPTSETLEDNTIETLFNLELRSISFVCVNCFILISGYFGIHWKLKSFSNLLFQILFWSIVCPVFVFVITNSGSIFSILTDFYNNIFSRWFVVSYMGLYMMAPMINKFIEAVTRRELGLFILVFYLFSTIFGYVGKAPDFNEGMSIISLMGLYLIGAYLRKNQDGIFGCSKYVYLGIYFLAGFVMVGIAAMALKAGITASPYGYLNPIIIIESIALFLFFKKLNIGSIPWINWIAVSAFAVYLIHMDSSVHAFYMTYCSYIETHFSLSFLYALIFMIGVFMVSVLADKVRICVYKYTVQKWLNLFKE